MPTKLRKQRVRQDLNEPDREASSLWNAYRAGGKRPEDHTRLVEHYLPLVAKQVERQSTRVARHVDRRELLSAGVIGLHRAIARFKQERNGNKNSNFSAFAARHIQGAIIDDLRRIDPLTRDQRRHYHNICAAIARLTRDLKKQPSLEQIATEVGMNVANVNMYLQLGQGTVSLHEKSEGDRSLAEVLPDHQAKCPRQEADKNLSHETLRECFRKLPMREQQLLYLRLYEGLRVSEVARVLGISEGRVSQIYNQTVGRLRQMMQVS